MNKSYFCRMFFLKYNRSIVILWRTTSMDFQKVIYENVEKGHSFHNKHIYIGSSQTFWSFMKFYLLHLLKVCFVFKNSHYAYIHPYMHNVPTTLRNEKAYQIEFYKKLLGELIFLRVTKNLKMFYFTRPTGRVLQN